MHRLLMLFRSLLAVVLAIAVLAETASAQPERASETAKREAKTAAQSWLALVEDGALAESWKEADSLFQQRIERADWIQKTERLRDSIGTVSARTLTRTQYRDTLRRTSANGPFVLLKYRSTSETGRFEELLLTVRKDTIWNVAGYQVTPLSTLLMRE